MAIPTPIPPITAIFPLTNFWSASEQPWKILISIQQVLAEFKILTFKVTGKLRTVMKAVKKSRKLFAAGDKNGLDLLIRRVGVDDDDGEDYWIFIDLGPFYKVYDDNDNDNDDKNYVKQMKTFMLYH